VPSTQFTPSPQQATIFDWVRTGHGNAIIEAVAGAGKTTTLIEAIRLMQGRITMVAFNKRIVDEIDAKLTERHILNARASTFHSLGLSTLRGQIRTRVYGRKDFDVMDTIKCPRRYRSFVGKAMSLAKQHAFGVSGYPGVESSAGWAALVDHFDLGDLLTRTSRDSDLEPEDDGLEDLTEEEHIANAQEYAIKGLNESLRLSTRDGVVNFDDMLWVPLVINAHFIPQDWVLVDEAQDTNPARREIVARMMTPRSRLIAVGDPHQAIYGFTGADADALDIIGDTFDCTTLPLTVTYRCPKSIVEVAQQWVSHITAHESAPDGEVEYIDHDALMELPAAQLDTHSAILCRNTKPLIELCYRFLKRDIRCHVEGREIGEGLVKLIETVAGKRISRLFPVFEDKLDEFYIEQSAKLERKNSDTKIGQLADKYECVKFLLTVMPGDATVKDLIKRVRSLFEDAENNGKGMTLSTIHKAKGREWDRVYWFGRDSRQPSRYAKKDWELGQETNLFYVAATRAKKQLIVVAE
jgi:superfamily I DNA/RNA helicase